MATPLPIPNQPKRSAQQRGDSDASRLSITNHQSEITNWVTRALLVLLLSLPAWSLGADLAQIQRAATELTDKVATRAGSGSAVHLSIKNRSSLTQAAVSQVRAAFNTQAQKHGWKLTQSEDAVETLDITLSENAREFVWTAELGEGTAPGSSKEVFFTSFPKSADAVVAPSMSITLAHTLLISSDEPLLDFTIVEGRQQEGARLIALMPTRVALFVYRGGHWQTQTSRDIAHAGSWPRDLRGRLMADAAGNFEAFLPGVHCTGTVAPDLTLNCGERDDPWPLSPDNKLQGFYAGTRNFFGGLLSGDLGRGHNVPPFYSAALLDTDNVVFTGADGRTRRWRISQQQTVPITAMSGGSEIAALNTQCSDRKLAIATRSTDFTQPDFIQGFQFTDRDAIFVTPPLELPGAVVSLTTSNDQRSGFAVVRTGDRYEAHLLTVACGS